MFIDTHAHISCQQIADPASLLARAHQAGILEVINICTDEESLNRGLALAASVTLPKVHTAAACTPHDVACFGEPFFSVVERHARAGALIAVGETGLDYHYEHSPRKEQQVFLQRYIRLAREVALPLIIHCRDAFEDFFAIAAESMRAGWEVRGVLHCFTGTMEEARQALDQGWYISFSGIVTFPKSDALRDVAAYVPLDRLLIETDTPYLAPKSKRGRPNEPAYLLEIATCLASLKNVSVEALARNTLRNAKLVFSI